MTVISFSRIVLRELVLLAFWAVAVGVATFPLASHVVYPTLGHIRDSWIGDIQLYQWNVWWMNQALTCLGTNPFETTLLFFPDGVPLFFTPFVPLFGLASIPLQQMVTGLPGAIWAVNVLTFAGLVASGWFTVHFLRYLGAGWTASIVAALPFVVAPFRILHLARVHHLASLWLPLYALVLLRYLDRGTWRSLLGAGLVGLATLLTDHQHFLFLLFVAMACVVYRLVDRRVVARVLLARVLRAAAVQVLLLIPLLPLVAGALQDRENLNVENRLRFERSRTRQPAARHLLLAPDLNNMAFILFPSLYRAVSDPFVDHAPPPHPANHDHARPTDHVAPQSPRSQSPLNHLPYALLYEDVFPVWTTARGWRSCTVLLTLFLLLLFAAGLLRRGHPGKWIWFGLALAAFVLALGPTRTLFGYPVPMPFRALAFLFPPLKISRYPASFIFLGLFALTPLLAGGFQLLLRSRFTAMPAVVASIVLVIGLGRERLYTGLLRFEVTPVPAAYRALARDPAPGAVVELPLNSIFLDRFAMVGQMVHGRPLARGCVVRVGPGSLRFLRSPGLMALLQEPWKQAGLPGPGEAALNLVPFFEAGFRYVLIHRHYYDGDTRTVDRVLALLHAHGPRAHARLENVDLFLFEPDPATPRPEGATRP